MPHRYLALLLLLLPVLSCRNDAALTVPVGTHLQVVLAPSSTGLPGYPLYDSIVVRLLDDDSLPRPGVPLRWVARDPGGSVQPEVGVTDADGRSVAYWTLGRDEGVQTLDVRTLDDSILVLHTEAQRLRVERLTATPSVGCGLRAETIWCWGIGLDRPADPVSRLEPAGPPHATPWRISRDSGYVDLAIGSDVICGLLADGTAQCEPLDSTMASYRPVVPRLHGLAGASEAQAFCGVALSDSTAWCWRERDPAAQLSTSLKFLDLRMATYIREPAVCGRLTDSTVTCWGKWSSALPGIAPTPVQGGQRYLDLAVGREFGCGRTATAELWCWGRADLVGGTIPAAFFTAERQTDGVTELTADDQSLLLMRHGAVWRAGLFEPDGTPTRLAGATGLLISGLTRGANCLQVVGGGVYCVDELVVTPQSGVLPGSQLYPVQPPRMRAEE